VEKVQDPASRVWTVGMVLLWSLASITPEDAHGDTDCRMTADRANPYFTER